MFYIMLYVTKEQKQVFNYLALGNGYAYHITHPVQSEVERAQSHHQLLLLWLMNAATFQQEISAPLAVSYVMGYGDIYQSHIYSPIYWTGFAHILSSIFCQNEYVIF